MVCKLEVWQWVGRALGGGGGGKAEAVGASGHTAAGGVLLLVPLLPVGCMLRRLGGRNGCTAERNPEMAQLKRRLQWLDY